MVPSWYGGFLHDLLRKIRDYLLKVVNHGHHNSPQIREIDVYSKLVFVAYLR